MLCYIYRVIDQITGNALCCDMCATCDGSSEIPVEGMSYFVMDLFCLEEPSLE
jgi:hypothetical protein